MTLPHFDLRHSGPKEAADCWNNDWPSFEQDTRSPEGQPASLFFPSHMKCFYRLRHREIEKPTKVDHLRLTMAFWLSVLAICLAVEAVAVIVVLRREWQGKEKTFTVDKIRR